MSRDIYNINLLEVMPPSISSDIQVQAISSAISPQLQEISEEIKECIILARLDELSEEVVDLLAWQYHVDFYEPDLPISKKRNLVRTAIDAHRHKGTPYAVELVVKAILEDAVVQEWFEYGGQPYFFRVTKINGQVTAEMYPKLKKAIETVKNTRSWLDGVALMRKVNASSFLGVSQNIHRKIEINPVAFKMPDISSKQYIGMVIHNHKKVEVG